MKFALIGAGGHAKAVVDILEARAFLLECYVSLEPAPWLNARHVADDGQLSDTSLSLAFGMGGVDPDGLERRLALFERFLAQGFPAPPLIHPSATISRRAVLGSGVTVMAGAIINAYAQVGLGAIVNSRAVVEHDAIIGAGSHVAPGALVLGGAQTGRASMVGAGSVVLQSTHLPDHGFVRAASLYRGEHPGTERHSS